MHIIILPDFPFIQMNLSIDEGQLLLHGVQRTLISVVNFFVFLRFLYFALLLLYVT